MAATSAGSPPERLDYDPGVLHPEDVEIAVEYCGVCHSDLAMVDSEWFSATYPMVPGHEIVGTIVAGDQSRPLGGPAGSGWHAKSCCHCDFCMGGEQNLRAKRQPTIIGRHGGFADKVRAHRAGACPSLKVLTRQRRLLDAVAAPHFCLRDPRHQTHGQGWCGW